MTERKYRAFISYSHESDARLAGALESSLTRFAKPWYRLRSLRVFEDKAGLSANPALWQSIEQALAQSEYLLLLASPASAHSSWVQREVQWWLKNRSARNLVLCLTEGTILWNNQTGDFDWEKTTALPPLLKGAFSAEPLYADFTAAKASGKYLDRDPAYRSALLDVASPLMGRAKDDLDGEDIRLHHRAEHIAWAVSFLIVLLGLFAAAGMMMAHRRQKVAASRALASEAASHLDDRSLAMLLAIESRRIADTVESRRSLLAAIQRVPHAAAFLWGHTDAVTKAVFSPDGGTILSAGWDNRLLFWNAATHQPIGEPVVAPKGLVSVAFNADGSQFAAAAGDSVIIWETSSRRPAGEPFHAGKGKEEFVHVGFSPNGKLLAASTDAYGNHPSQIFVWEIAGRQPIGEPIPGSGFAFSPDGALLAIARYNDLVLYDLRSHRERLLTGPTKNIASIAFSPDGALVAAGSEDKTIVVWDLQSRRPLGTLAGHSGTVNTLLFDPGGRLLFSGSLDGSIMRWDLEEMKAIDTPIQNLGAAISSIYLSPLGQVRALALENDHVILLDVNDDPPLGRRIRAPDLNSSNIAFSPDGRLLASSGEFGNVALWDVAAGEASGDPLSGHARQVSSLAFAPNGKLLVSGSMDGTVIFWEMATRKALGPPMKVFGGPIWSLACSPDSKMVAVGGDAQLAGFDLATRNPLGPPATSQKERIWALAFSPDGQYLASAGNDFVTAIWKPGPPLQFVRNLGTPYKGDDWELMPAGVSFNPEGRLMATSTAGHTVTLWNFKRGQPLPPLLYGHTQAVQSLAFRRDGKVLASGSADGDIRLWDVETHELLGTLNAQQTSVNGVVFAPRADTLASVGEDNSILFWDLDFEGWANRACRVANRNLTPKEWDAYLGATPYRKTCPDH